MITLKLKEFLYINNHKEGMKKKLAYHPIQKAQVEKKSHAKKWHVNMSWMCLSSSSLHQTSLLQIFLWIDEGISEPLSLAWMHILKSDLWS